MTMTKTQPPGDGLQTQREAQDDDPATSTLKRISKVLSNAGRHLHSGARSVIHKCIKVDDASPPGDLFGFESTPKEAK
jgi:hypothetical protein